MFGKLASRIKRKAQGATPSRHRAVFYDIRITNVEPEVGRVRMGWMLGKGRPAQWCASLELWHTCSGIQTLVYMSLPAHSCVPSATSEAGNEHTSNRSKDSHRNFDIAHRAACPRLAQANRLLYAPATCVCMSMHPVRSLSSNPLRCAPVQLPRSLLSPHCQSAMLNSLQLSWWLATSISSNDSEHCSASDP